MLMNTLKPRELSLTISQLLAQRLKDEQKASYFYNAATNWCAVKGYEGGKKYFHGEAMEEQEHFQELSNYITAMNINPELKPIEFGENFTSLGDIIEKAYELELILLDSYNSTSKVAFNEDFTTFEYLKKFRDIQRESVIRYSDLINQLALINQSNSFEVLYFDQTVLGKL